jgi:hypothetical protein
VRAWAQSHSNKQGIEAGGHPLWFGALAMLLHNLTAASHICRHEKAGRYIYVGRNAKVISRVCHTRVKEGLQKIMLRRIMRLSLVNNEAVL